MAEQLSNNAAGTLNGGINNAVTSLALNAGQGAAFPSSGNFRILIDSELILVGARSTDTLSSLTRGIEGTAAASHSNGAAVTHIITQAGLLAYIQDNSVQKPSGIVTGETAVWNGSTWVRSSTTKLLESGVNPGTNGQYLQTSGGATAWGSPPVIAPTHLPGVVVSQGGGNALVANTAYLIPIPNVVIATSIGRLVFRVRTQSGNMDLGIYFSDDEITFTRLFSTGTFAVPAAAVQYKSITSQVLSPVTGRRWYYALACDNGTAVFDGGAAAFRDSWGAYSKATSFVLPSSLTAMTADPLIIPSVHGAI